MTFLSRIARRVALCSITPPPAALPGIPPPAPAVSSRSFHDLFRSVRGQRTSRPKRRNRLVLVVYTAAIFVSALLLFSVQPLFTKMVLPRLGGSPAVWSVAMVFFQSLLLGGYAYAHFLMQIRNRAIPVAVHLVLLAVAMLTLPLSICERVGRSADLRLCVLAARPVCGLDRAAVLCARRQQSAAASLVRPHRPPQRSRPVFPLCFLEHRQLPGAVVLSGTAGADVHAAHAEPDLDRRLWPADRADRKLRRVAAALAGEGGGD